MLLKQLFDNDSFTFTYLLADESSGKAALIDPVLNNVDTYIQMIQMLGLKLELGIDTHVHADHITALGALRKKTGCSTYIGNVGDIACADNGLADGLIISLGAYRLHVIYTPGHTDDSYSFLIQNDLQRYLFTGDTLLIRGSGRTDFQNGNPEDLYHSLHDKLMTLPEDTVVYPGHDYNGKLQSTVGEEKKHNPRINLSSKAEFIAHMNNLNLPDPKLMDVAVSANRTCGNG